MKNLLSKSFAIVAVALMLSSCGCYNSMMKQMAENLDVTCSPEYVTLKGDNAVTTVSIAVPAKAFDEWAVLKLTPVIVYDGGETAGSPVFFQGVNVEDNYTVVPYETASTMTINVSIPYSEEMRQSTLIFRGEAKCLKQGNKIKEFTALPDDFIIADGVSSIQNMANSYAEIAIAPDSFQRVTYTEKNAAIQFQINRANVRTSELNSDDIAALEQFIIDNNIDPKRTVGDVYTQAYASPDGPLTLNDKLSVERGETTHKALENRFKKNNVPADTRFDINAMGEDWEGFKELVQESNIEDKNLILQVLAMYSDPQVRDREIKNMTATFTVLAEKILPELRRSKMTVNVEIQGLTDEELKDAVANNISSLTADEMLFAATLYSDNATKAEIYKAAADQYNDYRAWNNYGTIMAWEGEYPSTETNVEKAAAINNSNPQVINNLGVLALAEGDKEEAAKYFDASTAPEAKYNKGLVELANGNYSSAASSLTGYNKGLAQFLNDDYAGAKSTLSTVDNWEADYLKAVIAAREGDEATMLENLSLAVDKGGDEAAELAATDVNFIEYISDEAFLNALK
ncbi:MAG: hypothetical protein R3Y49_00095 [Rikenellaceae bacterium]